MHPSLVPAALEDSASTLPCPPHPDASELALMLVGRALAAGLDVPAPVRKHLLAAPAEHVEAACRGAREWLAPGCPVTLGHARAVLRGACWWAGRGTSAPQLLPPGGLALLAALLDLREDH
jgi:hypothetical protein